ncbi:calcium/sodium antiporter [Mangrovicoccus sp. HB161399]|uniref:calcium/sodium antiporter n=1 Tax=Mangrovicoccus sp. HB161399 TaxID=2720392 RepID=UPI001555AF5C|nr:calcium/sodium antiporter [Mangrovicoccus sp. HB161399]
MIDWVYTGLGLLILVLAGDALVKGAVNLALRLGIPALIVGLTIVAFGTSAPELLISIKAVLDGVPGIALGNVVGSNTANVLLVLGIPALIAPMMTAECDTRKSYYGMLAGSVLFIALCYFGPITWLHGAVLLAMLAAVLWDQARDARAHRRALTEEEELEEVEGADPSMPGWKIAVWLVLGLVGLPLGANLLIEGAVNIARDFGISETAIGLTLVAVGTSLPELATTVMAALRRHAEVALGNVIGSNTFNLLGIMGVTSLVRPVPVDPQFLHMDLWVMLGASLIMVPFVILKRNIGRVAGGVLVLLYVGYLAAVLG